MEAAKVTVANPCWMNPIIDFLAEDKVPNDEDEAKKIRLGGSPVLVVFGSQTVPKVFRRPLPFMFTS